MVGHGFRRLSVAYNFHRRSTCISYVRSEIGPVGLPSASLLHAKAKTYEFGSVLNVLCGQMRTHENTLHLSVSVISPSSLCTRCRSALRWKVFLVSFPALSGLMGSLACLPTILSFCRKFTGFVFPLRVAEILEPF